MPLSPPPFLLAPRRVSRKRRARRAPARPPGLLVASVVVDPASPLHVTVTFSGAIETDSTLPENFLCAVSAGGGSRVPPADVLDSGDDWIELLFLDGVAAGAAWQIVGPLAGITPPVAWPQAGVVE